MEIDTSFDSGSIDVLDASSADGVTLALRRDNASDFVQWFHFRALGARGVPAVYHITNAGDSSYPGGWPDYRACASYDGERWFRVPTEYDQGRLTLRHTSEHDSVVYACSPPYSTDRYGALARRAHVIELGRSVEGRPIHLFEFGDPARHVPRVWIIAHQHPGETMAGFCAEGIIDRLLNAEDDVTRALTDRAVVYVVPRINPDGAARGNHRTNVAGRDLNREWLSPSPEASPEVACVRRAIEERGIDMFLDVHGEEALPYVFAFGAEGTPSYSERKAGLEAMFLGAMTRVDDDFQTEQGYEREAPGTAHLGMAHNYVSERYDCLSMGLELPFKDNANRPDEGVGWSPDRSRKIGRSVLEAVLACVGSLR